MCKIYIKSNKRGFFDLTKENSMNEQSYIQQIGLINIFFSLQKKKFLYQIAMACARYAYFLYTIDKSIW